MGNTEKNTFSIPTQQELEQLSELHKTMGDYSRMKILWLLMGQELCVSDLAKQMNITKSAVSHQLRELRITRLVQSHRVGKNVFYSLSDEHIQWVLEETYKMQSSFRIRKRWLRESARYLIIGSRAGIPKTVHSVSIPSLSKIRRPHFGFGHLILSTDNRLPALI